MKGLISRLLKSKMNNKASSLKSPLLRYAVSGGVGFLMFLLPIVLFCVILFGPIIIANEYLDSFKSSASSFFEKVGNLVTFKGWCTDEECAKNSEQLYQEKLKEVYDSYKEDGVEIDVDLITATVYYHSAFEDKFSADVGDDDSYELADDINISDVKKLASNMVSGSSIDYDSYRNYLINTYIPKRFSDLYKTDKEKEDIADEIMMYARKEYVKGNDNSSYLPMLCPEICNADGECWNLEEYVARSIMGSESFSFKNLSSTYSEEWKAYAVVVRTNALKETNYCSVPISSNLNSQVDKSEEVNADVVEIVKETKGKILTYDGELIDAKYDSFSTSALDNYRCDDEYCYSNYEKVGGSSNVESHEIKIPKTWESLTNGGTGEGMSLYGALYLADTGKNYEEILEYFYSDDVKSSVVGGANINYSAGEIAEELLFPLGVNTKTGNCVSAGNWYNPSGRNRKYHGAVDISGAMMGYSKPYSEIPVIASHGGVITALAANNWCTDVNLPNKDTRLPKVKGCQGNHMTIKVTDKGSKYYNYTFIYYHFDSIDSNLKIGDYVQTGQFLGYMGSTGNSTGFHLHIKIKNPSGGDLNNTPVSDYLTNLIKNYCKNNVGGKNG